MSIRILELYGQATLQGLPQHGLRAFGVPPGGAFDQESLLLANAMAGNATDAPAIEFALAAASIEVVQPSLISLVGAECEIFIDGRSTKCQSAYQLLPGQVIEIRVPKEGCRIYLGLPGITTQKKLDRALINGNVIHADPHRGQPGKVRALLERPSSLSAHTIRVIAHESLPSASFTVSIKSNRVGVRLEGKKMQPGEERLSEPSCPGVIQVTNDGALVIHGPDGPTIGGYKKVGVVCSADMDRVGQLRSRDEVKLQTITQAEAIEAWQTREKELEAKLNELRLLNA